MKKLTLVVDERELNAMRAALLLLREQIDVLPEDLAEMLRQNGDPLSDGEIEELSRRLWIDSDAAGLYPQKKPSLRQIFLR